MKQIIGILGWIIGIQGALGLIGRLTTGNDWGMLRAWFEPHPFVYAAMVVVGFLLALPDERRRRSRAQSSRS
ncbi:hypothetical protein DY218_30895 [Streptomyces triticagri]|uniref:Uncharacterized protein n=1 Tax=Streptomyces triticagri TaxID=2293568 RepID=A0A372LVX0_9ACTN|nr:hypothetical protein [Streptomyces triticagri]RFU82826.1 hypothetical protein DY218_30895 [Streptomyces triticagri]